MSDEKTPALLDRLGVSPRAKEDTAPAVVDALVGETVRLDASDLHLLPEQAGLRVQWRVDGVLGAPEWLPIGVAANIVARFKVLAGLLTYETQTPQEGRFRAGGDGAPFRVSTFPTLFGEKVVARRLPSGDERLAGLADLGLLPSPQALLQKTLDETSGAVLLVGPSGSGKTTTAYAALREIGRRSGGRRSIATLEDPIEVVLPGVAQSQAAPHAGFDLRVGLRTLVRQDPEVILVGEIRDAETAQIAYQAALTGQLVVTTFHATDAAAAVVRLLDMGIPAYLVRGATRAIVAQRLLRKSCRCRANNDGALRPPRADCDACHGSGYRGRCVIAEGVDFAAPGVSAAVREGVERQELEEALRVSGAERLRAQAEELVRRGVTDQQEVERLLGNPRVVGDNRAT